MNEWKCPNCEESIEGNFETCWNCGTSPDGTPPANPAIFVETDQPFDTSDIARYFPPIIDFSARPAAVDQFRPRNETRIPDAAESGGTPAYSGPPCVCCGRTEFSFGAVNAKFYEAGSVMFSNAMDIRARRCLTCGNLQLFSS